MIAALFVEKGGVYYGLPDVEPWDAERDARLYAGPWPVVAHPPCQLWTNMARVNFKRYGGEHNRPGNDGGCFSAARAAVRSHGGVLEHPAGSHAWPEHGIMRPDPKGGWSLSGCGGWVCEVWQSAYGHKARKRTWLYCCAAGSGPSARPPELDWTQREGTHQIGWFDRKKPTIGKREACATPAAFRDALLVLARSAP
jgi:hypothetical protein